MVETPDYWRIVREGNPNSLEELMKEGSKQSKKGKEPVRWCMSEIGGKVQ